MASAVSDNAITSRSENLGTTPLLGMFPNSFTRFFDELLAYVKNFSVFCTKVVYVSFICI